MDLKDDSEIFKEWEKVEEREGKTSSLSINPSLEQGPNKEFTPDKAVNQQCDSLCSFVWGMEIILEIGVCAECGIHWWERLYKGKWVLQ